MTPKKPRKYICGSTKNDGKTVCKRPVSTPGERCYWHSGRKLKQGHKHDSTSPPRYSRELPPEMQAKLIEAYSDPELLSHRRHAAIYEIRVDQLLARIESGESGEIWRQLRETWNEITKLQLEMKEAKASGDSELFTELQARFAKSLGSIGKFIDQGSREEATWQEIVSMANQSSAMKERETKRLESERMMVPIPAVLALMAHIYAEVRYVAGTLLPPDASTALVKQVGTRLQKVMNLPDPAETQIAYPDGVIPDVEIVD